MSRGQRGGLMHNITRSNRNITRSNRRKAVLRVQFAHERAWTPRGASNENAVKGSDRSMWNSDTPWVGGQSTSRQRMLERLEVENAQLRGSVVELMLQIQALRDGARTLTGSRRGFAGKARLGWAA